MKDSMDCSDNVYDSIMVSTCVVLTLCSLTAGLFSLILFLFKVTL